MEIEAKDEEISYLESQREQLID